MEVMKQRRGAAITAAALGLVLGPRVAAADDRAVVQKAALASLAALPTSDTVPVAKGGVVWAFGVTNADDEWRLALVGGSGEVQTVKYKPGKTTVVVDATHGLAWWLAPVDAHADVISDESGTGDLPAGMKPYNAKERFGGLAVKNGTHWDIEVLALSHTMPDRDLLDPKSWAADDALAPAKPNLDGDAAIAGTVAGWFPTLAKHAAAPSLLVACGTDPSELRTGAAAAKLAVTWDKLGLTPVKVTATPYADGKAALVQAHLLMPRKTGKGSVAMTVAMLVVHVGDDWKWVSLQFTPG